MCVIAQLSVAVDVPGQYNNKGWQYFSMQEKFLSFLTCYPWHILSLIYSYRPHSGKVVSPVASQQEEAAQEFVSHFGQMVCFSVGFLGFPRCASYLQGKSGVFTQF